MPQELTNPRICLHCCTSTRSAGLALSIVSFLWRQGKEHEAYTDCNERSSCCPSPKDDSMSLLLTAASELRLRNEDCAESGSFFTLARSRIDAENSETKLLSDIRKWLIWKRLFPDIDIHFQVTEVGACIARCRRSFHRPLMRSKPLLQRQRGPRDTARRFKNLAALLEKPQRCPQQARKALPNKNAARRFKNLAAPLKNELNQPASAAE
jgi:hypothetical protein